MTRELAACSVCAAEGVTISRCAQCGSLVCARCVSERRCVNCAIEGEDGARWFSPAALEPLGRLPRRLPLSLLLLVILGPLIIVAVAALMGQIRPAAWGVGPRAPVRFRAQ